MTPLTFDQLRNADIVAIDTETTGLSISVGKDYMQGFSLAVKEKDTLYSRYIAVRHADDEHNMDPIILGAWLDVLAEKRLIFHNRKFDLHSLMTAGIDLSKNFAFDTLLLAHLVNEEHPYEKSLDALGKMYLKRGKTLKDKTQAWGRLYGWGTIPFAVLEPYAREDAELTYSLWEVLFGKYTEQYGTDAGILWQTELDMNTALFNMELLGIGVDQKFCRDYSGIANLEMDLIESELDFEPSKTTALSTFLFKELNLPVLETTPTGKPKMDKHVMEEYERMLMQVDDPRASMVLNYRGWQKARSTFYLPFQTLTAPDGRIHCNYKQHGTVTGRLSCSEPNLQQIPRSSEKVWNGRIRSAFRASPGYRLMGYDYSQLEFRLAAAYGNERWLIDEFAQPDSDVFTALSERIGTDRYTAKTFTYAMIYGAGQEKIAKTLNREVADIEEQYNNFVRSIPGILATKNTATGRAKSRGYVRYWTGRRRHFRNPEDSYKAFNSLLQGGAAEVVKHVLIDIAKNICDQDCRLLLQVHDELVFEIREGLEDYYEPFIINAMSSLPTDRFGVQFHVSGKLWGEA